MSTECDERRTPRLPTGFVTIYRPARTRDRPFTTKDMRRIIRKVECTEGKRKTICGIIEELDPDGTFRRLLGELRRAWQEVRPEPDSPQEKLVDLVANALEAGAELADWLDKSLIGKALGRFAWIKLIKAFVVKALKILNVVSKVASGVSDLLQLIGELDCEEPK